MYGRARPTRCLTIVIPTPTIARDFSAVFPTWRFMKNRIRAKPASTAPSPSALTARNISSGIGSPARDVCTKASAKNANGKRSKPVHAALPYLRQTAFLLPQYVPLAGSFSSMRWSPAFLRHIRQVSCASSGGPFSDGVPPTPGRTPATIPLRLYTHPERPKASAPRDIPGSTLLGQ